MSNLEMWLWSFLLVVALPAAAAGGTRLVRRSVSTQVLARQNDVAGFIYAVIGVVYAVLLGFTAIIVWEQFRKAQEGAELEANALADLYRNAQVFPDDVRHELDIHLRDYARLVVEDEWPAMAKGKSSPATWDAFNQLWTLYHEFKPGDDHQHTWYDQSIQTMNLLGDQRRDRLLNIHAGVPMMMWFVLISAGMVTIAFSFFFGSPNPRAQAVMTAALALTIGIVLLSILALEHPFAGLTRVNPEAFIQVREILDRQVQPVSP